MTEQVNEVSQVVPDGDAQLEEATPLEIAQGEAVEEPTGAKRARVVLMVILILLLLLMCVAAGLLNSLLNGGRNPLNPKVQNGIIWIRSIYGFGTAVEELHNPGAAAITPDGRSFWVADSHSARLLKYSWQGRIEEIITHDADGRRFEYPNAIAVGPSNGWYYVTQQTYSDIIIFDQNWNRVAEIDQVQAMSIDVNSEMVLVGGRGGFGAYTLEGDVIGFVGNEQRGNAFDEFDTISGVVLDGESNAYILDTYNNRVSKFNAEGEILWITEMGPAGNSLLEVSKASDLSEIYKQYPAALQTPMGITMDGAGRIIIMDSHDFSITAWSAEDGTYLGLKWGDFGEADGSLAYANEITYNSRYDQFVLTEPVLGRAQIIALEGSNAGIGGLINNLRGRLGPLLAACCWPLIIVLIVLAIYYIIRRITKKRESEEEYVIDAEDIVSTQE